MPGRCRSRVSNDANCAAYAETHHGAATDSRHVLYLTGTVGIGAGHRRGRRAGARRGGLRRRGRPHAGRRPGRAAAAAAGGAAGRRRSACTRCSTRWGCPSSPPRSPPREAVAARAATDAGGPRRRSPGSGRDVGLGLAVLASVLDPAVVVLGGYFAPLGDLVLDPARRTLDERLVSDVQRRPELRPGTLGIQAAALGAAE